MPTIIDSLMIELGLDTSKFDAAQKKSVEELRKFDEQQQKTAKKTQEEAKKTGNEFNKTTQAVLEYFLAYVGVSQIKDFVSNTTKANVEVGRSANLLNVSARELKTWGDIAEITGGSIEDMSNTLLGLQESLAQVKRGNAEILKPVALLGAEQAFDINKSTVDMFKLADAVKAFIDLHPDDKALALSYVRSLGVTDKWFLALEQGGDALRKQYKDFDALNEAVNRNAESANQVNKEWVETKKQAQSLGNTIYDFLLTPINLVNKGLQYSILGFRALFSGSLDPIRESAKRKVEAMDADKAGKPEVGVTSSGNIPPRNERNKNPGNLKYGDFAKRYGAVGADKDGFAIFRTMEEGAAAQQGLLKSKYDQGLDTLHKLYYGSGNVKGWLGSGADLKDAPNAIKNVGSMTGLGEFQHIDSNQLSMLRQAMQNNEGMIGSKVSAQGGVRNINNSSEMSVQNMNIYTNATDATGLAKDLPRQLKNNAMMGSAMLGSD
jgi:hypothetical protein